jgi:hypothetical protein
MARGIVCAVVVVGLTCGAFAEVGVKRDPKGRYVGAEWRIQAVKPLGQIWSTFNADASGINVLNPRGDANGDLWPAVVENTVQPHHPWVVWSRFNGKDYDLAWSRWKGARWSMIRTVHRASARGDDLDADLAFGRQGRPYLVWWRNDHGIGRVYLSIYLNSQWMSEIGISARGTNSRRPTIEVLDDGTIMVEYETPRGLLAHQVQFNRPVTITDDINPFSHVHVGEAYFVEGQ